MFKFEGKIQTCKQCNGWGTQKGSECLNCHGRGVYILDGSRMLAFDVPPFIDYGLRQRIRLLRSAILLTISLFLIGILISTILILIQIFR